jgi:hypothetical protein
MNPVLVHSCFSACEPVKIGSGARKMFHPNPNASCSCSYRVSFADRDDKLERGEAYVLICKNGLGHSVPEWREIVLVGKNDRLPVAATISEQHITRAYVDDEEYDRERIAHYGSMTQGAFFALGASSLLVAETANGRRIVSGS